MDTDNEITDIAPLVDFASKVEDKSKNIIKVVGVGGGGCNAGFAGFASVILALAALKRKR